MASFKHKKINVYFPEEITIEILSRLPVKALVRFCCVCKSWLILIRNSTFISRHLIQSTINSNGGNLLITSHSQACHSYRYTYMDVYIDGAFDAPIDSGKVLPSLELTGHLNIISNNGLLCIDSNTYHSYVIWNPATKFFREIPKLGNVKVDACINRRFLRFGVLGETNNYKLISYLNEDADYGTRYLDQFRTYLRVEKMKVYSRSTGLWREINHTSSLPMNICIHKYVPSKDYSQIQVNGVVYWILYGEGFNTSDVIMGFEIQEEKFLQLAMPYDFEYRVNCKLTEIEGSPTLINFSQNGYSCHAWKMIGNREGWDIKLTIEDLNGYYRHTVWGWKSSLIIWNWLGWVTFGEPLLSIQRLNGAELIILQEIKNCLISYKSNYTPEVHRYVESLIQV